MRIGVGEYLSAFPSGLFCGFDGGCEAHGFEPWTLATWRESAASVRRFPEISHCLKRFIAGQIFRQANSRNSWVDSQPQESRRLAVVQHVFQPVEVISEEAEDVGYSVFFGCSSFVEQPPEGYICEAPSKLTWCF